MPFLRRLLRREHYRLHAHYSGLPSTTPAVQAELFYGVKGAVPAFSFRDHESRRIVRMYEPEMAANVEALHAGNGNEALLEGGSAYRIFTGGAAESHFCPSSMGWGPTLRAANPLVQLAFLISNFYSFVRVGVLLLLELGLALVDFVRGLVDGQDFVKELKFIPTRVAISILLRELCVIGGKIDISRGLPVIHLNFLGYDEQSHRRGPGSLFAHWTLKGIDDAVARLWRAANHSAWRHYEVWIYSDHGQAAVRPYQEAHGHTLEEAVTAAFEKLGPSRAHGSPARRGGHPDAAGPISGRAEDPAPVRGARHQWRGSGCGAARSSLPWDRWAMCIFRATCRARSAISSRANWHARTRFRSCSGWRRRAR